MTIAVGFVCRDGVILCADSEMTTWTAKSHARKVDLFDFPLGSVGHAYAGNSAFALSAIQRCADRLSDVHEQSKVLAIIRGVVIGHYRQHVLKHPQAASDPSLDYSLLLAIRMGAAVSLYHCQKTAVFQVQDFECIGIGSDLTRLVIAPCFTPMMTYDEALRVCVYALKMAKLGVPGCGGISIFQLMDPHGLTRHIVSHNDQLQAAERISEEFLSVTGELIRVLLNREVNNEQLSRYLSGELTKRLIRLRVESGFVPINPAVGQYPQPPKAEP